eukprot:TRINITY_DN4738_c0_g1_i2.p1 TRINITY_DN4738_c0_g1~~TRINITY_DN4738_c0_g1_i2.p1  ORF type:complete len:187 (+),score=39.26 TRINITY_DN4738_c0_g1_i2:702-1262(+)
MSRSGWRGRRGWRPALGPRRWAVVDGKLAVVDNADRLPYSEEFAGGKVPETLRGVLETFFVWHVPMLEKNLGLLLKTLGNPKNSSIASGAKPIPRVVGSYTFTLPSGEAASRAAFPNELYKLSRSARFYSTLAPFQKEAVAGLLSTFRNGETLLSTMQRVPPLFIYGESALYTAKQDSREDVHAKL